MLCALGLVMVLSASIVTSYEESGSSFTIFSRQLMWVVAGAPLLWAASRLPVVVLRRLTYLLLLGTLVLLALTQTPLGVSVNGNRNWIDVGGPFRLQPSELAKLALAVWGADLLARKHRLLVQWKHLLVPLVPVSVLVLGLVLLGRDLGTSLVLMAITGALLFFAGAPMRLFGLLGGAALALVVALTVSSDNRRARLLSFADPSADPLGAGWQLLHSKYALGSGGWFGLGLGASREKWNWLPEQQTDFIFAVIGEELGLVGTVVVLALFAALAYGGLRIALRTDDLFVRLCAAAITSWILVQAMVNVGAVLGVLPIAGIPLPLVSYGGSALLPTMVALGILLSFARQERGAAEALAARGPSPLRRAAWAVRGALPARLPRPRLRRGARA
ncbi:putative lipid II flippase FtsW [Vallicoccus soli]|uniref:Probable peptidoglycan glycosyltransferase FtsW n=2 Tax=Vallicoccus soli TaxID=2339232 RepID=A0A3A3Z653_9ACTN|nr:putative lipid II flippase FtsW [Vallicoccus soli]